MCFQRGWKRTAAPTEKERVHYERQPDRDQVAYYKNRRQKTADATESRAIKRDNEPKTMDETFLVEAEIQSLSVSFILDTETPARLKMHTCLDWGRRRKLSC